MKAGDPVYVWPHGDESQRACAKVLVVAGDTGMAGDTGIIVKFQTPPSFARLRRTSEHPEGVEIQFVLNAEVVMVCIRHVVDGKPVGPWIELGGGHYEIEPIPDSEMEPL